MQHFSFLLLLTFFGLPAFAPTTNPVYVLQGKITDASGEPIIGAVIKVFKDSTFLTGTISNVDGDYRFQFSEPGTVHLEVSYTGYATKKITGIALVANTIVTVDVELSADMLLEEVQITAHKVPVIQQDNTQSGQVLTSEQIHRIPSRPAGAEPKESRRAKRKSAEKTPVPAATPTPAKSDLARETSPSDDWVLEAEAPVSGIIAGPEPRAGLLTAGEWNDLHNWGKHWTDLLTDGEIDAYQHQYKFYPRHRFGVLLQNQDSLPIGDAAVQLLDANNQVIWEARTDNMGRAELWAGFFDGKNPPAQLRLQARIDGQNYPLGPAVPFSQGIRRHQIQRECRQSTALDVLWVVDATGSMGDELEYLKTELQDVIGQVKFNNPALEIRMGSVFYRDEGDDYVVRSSPLDADIAKTIGYIGQQSAAGGGDYPEAVHSALEAAIFQQAWSAEAVARICFLVLDASPHQTPEVAASLQKSIRDAARQGIRIVPVSASGIQKDTEFLMKFFGLATNGTYVFLTDHSGVGGKHLEPTTDEYKVEALNNLLVRLITEYSAQPSCEGKSSIRFAAQQASGDHPEALPPVQYFPNPSSQQFSLDLPFDADKITLYDAEGKAVRNLTQLQTGLHTVVVSDLAPGFYTLRIWKNNQVQSGKLLVLRS
ncbi:MAG: carboxypeptidase regulatory-like domain-containing protein [Saprospiraceae bacterium]|nr:carboxypeptidase regulatory-like domain-containing protein [Saprospiraceae bacterium]